MEIGSAQAGRGEAAFGSVPISELYDGSPVEIPVAIMRGAVDGPVLWIQNGVHGDEYVGAAAIGRLIREVDPRQLRGSLVLIPELNIQAFRAGTRMAPQDGLDMNRTWPGAPMERAMHLWAHSELVTQKLLGLIRRHADAVMDIHDAGWMGLMSPYVTYYQGTSQEFQAKVRAMALACGMDLIWEANAAWIAEKAPGSARVPLNDAGIPSVEVECGGEGRVRSEHVGRMYRAFLNVVKHLGMMDGEPELSPNPIEVTSARWVRAPIGGYLFVHVKPLDRVDEGQLLATITDLFGRPREMLTAPVSGWIVGNRTFGTVATGQYVATVAYAA